MSVWQRFLATIILASWLNVLWVPPHASASCGAVSCFVTIGSQQQVAMEGLLTVNGIYSYTPMRLLPGTNGVIPGIDTSSAAADPGSPSGDQDHHADGDL